MDSGSGRPDNQEVKLHSHGQSSRADIMELEYLKEITNDFSDERILGQGGFGVVYKGVLQNGEMVAIKKLLQPMPNFVKQFKNEVDLLVRLKHPNIVQLIGYCYETQHVHMDYNGEFIFAEMTQSLLCLEYLPKGSLDGYISDESCGLDWRTRYTIIEGICNGLQYLHKQIKPIIHLDLKPANILLTDNMVPKVTDFGLSRLLDQQQTICTLITNGTRGYMPPEYIQGGTITPMSDIFSLGVIMLELVTGHRDYPDITRTSPEDFIELTLKKWSDVLKKTPGYTSLEVDCQQIKNCIQIGLICVNPERTKRPTAAKVIKMLQGLESMECHGGSEATSSASLSRSGPRELLDIYPLELCFSLDPGKPCLVKLTNKTDGYVAFHFMAIKATNKYCIEPSSGFLWPRSPLNVVVTMEEPCELPRDFRCHDEFLVQSIIVSMERLVSEHITEDTFNKVSSKAVQKVNLSVVYETPSQLPPLLRVGSEETKATNLQQLEGLTAEATEGEALKDDVYTAAAFGDLEKLQLLVEAEGRSVKEPDSLGYHALQWAALNNRVATAQYILEHGADVNAVDHTGQTALHWSSVRGHVQVANLLLKRGAKVDASDLHGYQATHVAAQYGQTTFIDYIVENWNANPDVPDNDGRSPLHWAAYKGFADSIRFLLYLDAYRLRQDKEGCTPLHWAAICGNLEACTALVQSGKRDDVMVKNITGLTPVQLAANKGHRQIAFFLAEGSSAESALAAPIDDVKQCMEAIYAKLQNAAGLTQLSRSVEDVFSIGDLPEASETLATMRHCFSVGAGEVVEFANMRKQLEVLEERLDEMVQPRLFGALSNHKVDDAQDLRGILTCIRKFNPWKVPDIKIHLKPLKELWVHFVVNQRTNRAGLMNRGGESIRSLLFSRWLPSFYDETVLYLEQEWKWCSTIFPGGFRTLVPIVLIETMRGLNSSFISHLNEATGDVPETRYVAKGVLDDLSNDLPKSTKLQNTNLVALIELHNMTGTFARIIRHIFSESDRGILLDTMKFIYSPYEIFKVRYGQMERAVLSAAMAGIDIRGTIPRGAGAQGLELSETVHKMNASIPHMIALLEAAVERCISLTGGSEADELILVLDDIMLQYISSLEETLKPLRTVCGQDDTAHCDASKKAGLEKKEATRLARIAFQVLTVAECLTSRTSIFEASLRASLARIGTYFSRSRSRFSLDIATIRLTSLPDKSVKLSAVLKQSKDLRFHVLPVTSQRVAAFSEIVNELVYDVLMSRVRQSLREIALLPIWSSMEEQGGPSSSAYPQEYLTSVGDYLLNLPVQCLEPLDVGITGSGAGSDVPGFYAEEWISKVAEGATALFLEQLRGIHYITDRGAQQLAADMEYLNNVLSALSMPIPPFLSTFHACISTPRDQVPSLIKSDGGSQLDLPTAHLVSKIRRILLN